MDKLCKVLAAIVLIAWMATNPGAARSQGGDDLAICADDRVKTSVLSKAEIATAEAACGRVLAASPHDADRQKAAVYRALMRMLQVVSNDTAEVLKPNGAASYTELNPTRFDRAYSDLAMAIAIDGPLRTEALSLRATLNQYAGRSSEALADIGQAMQQPQQSATPYVQRALEHERRGDVNAALGDLNRALDIDPKAGGALYARGELLRRLGELDQARTDLAGVIALGPPLRDLALQRKSELELRAGDLRAAYNDLLAASREPSALPKSEAAAARAALLVSAADLALDKLREPDLAERHLDEAKKLAPRSWAPILGLARVAEARGDRAKAISLYRSIIAGSRATPQLYERLIAEASLRLLIEPLLRKVEGPFRDAAAIGVHAGKGSTDGLKRIAFIIGISDYSDLASLPNARRDAAVIAHALADLGFDSVELAENLKAEDLRKVPGIIGSRAAGADIVMVLYAGHGVEVGGVNYIVPADAVPDSDSQLLNRALAVPELSAAAGKARRGALLIVDACRDDPFVEARAVARSRSTGGRATGPLPDRLKRGLAAMPSTPPNSVVFHSTQAGQTALDGDGLDSPFIRSFLETLSTPSRALDDVLKDTTSRVSVRTEGKQVPAAYGVAPTVALLPPAQKR